MELGGAGGRTGTARVVAGVSCGVALLGAGGVLIFSWFFAAIGCDEGCYSNASWTTRADAWQWDIVGWLAFTAAAFVGTALLLARRWAAWTAWLMSGAAVATYAAEWVLVNHASANTAGDFILWLLAEVGTLLIAVAAGQYHSRPDAC